MNNILSKSRFPSWKKQLACVTILLLALLYGHKTYAQDPAQYGTPFSGVPDTRDINMYQVNIRAYSAGSNLAGVNTRMQNIKDLGTNVVYLMPVFPVGTDSRSKVASSTSPYSIKDFKSVGTEYGTLTDLRSVVDNAHSKGMAVILDWVVNQTSWDHPWITQHPDWYVRSNGVIQQLGSFSDVAALDMNNTTMRAAMIDAMRYWVFAANVDGFRCDYANNAPLTFWSNVISNLRGISSHKLIMFAEGDRIDNFQPGFDLNFGDKWYYDALKPIHNGTSVAQIQTTNDTEYTYATGSQQMVRYTGNHDSNGDGTPLEQLGGTAGVMANFVVSAYMKGVPFLYGSQEVAFATRIPWPWDGVDINWTPNAPVTSEFTKVLSFRTASNAIRRGTMTNYSDANICAFTKISGTEKVVVLSNLRNGTFNYTIPAALAGNYSDVYTGVAVTLTTGSQFSLAAYQYRTLTSSNVSTVAVTGVSVSPTTASLAVNATSQLNATISPSNATNKTVSWASSNTSIATVSSAGLVTAKASGTATITVTTQDGNKTANATVTVTGGTGIVYYQIINRWQANSYLYDAGNGQVKYGTTPGASSYQWAKVDAGGGYFILKNRATGSIMHVENQNGSVQSTAADPTWWSAMWSIPTNADGWNTIQNRWQTSQMVHIENLLGYAQYSGAQAGWYSAMWKFVNPVTVP